MPFRESRFGSSSRDGNSNLLSSLLGGNETQRNRSHRTIHTYRHLPPQPREPDYDIGWFVKTYRRGRYYPSDGKPREIIGHVKHEDHWDYRLEAAHGASQEDVCDMYCRLAGKPESQNRCPPSYEQAVSGSHQPQYGSSQNMSRRDTLPAYEAVQHCSPGRAEARDEPPGYESPGRGQARDGSRRAN